MLFRLSAPSRSKKRRPAKNLKKHHRVASKSRFSVCVYASKISRTSLRTRFSSESRYKKLSQRPRTATSGLLGACWTQLGHSWAPQEASRDSLGALLGALGRLLGRSWGALGRSWALLGSSGASTFSRNSLKSAKKREIVCLLGSSAALWSPLSDLSSILDPPGIDFGPPESDLEALHRQTPLPDSAKSCQNPGENHRRHSHELKRTNSF